MQTEEKNKGVSIIVPVYNEEIGIEKTLRDIKNALGPSLLEYEILVINDGSTDKTYERVLNYKASLKHEGEDKIKLLGHSFKKGYGAAIKTGISNSLSGNILIIDGDGTYPADSIPALIKEIGNADMIVGARICKHVEIPVTHRLAKWLLNALANYLTNCKIADLNSGLRIMNKNIVNKFMNILPDGFSFTSTITLAMHINGYKIKYMPISYYKRTGRSKISPVYQAFNFLQLIIRTVMYFDPLRVFLPLSFMFFIASLTGFIYRIIEGRGLAVFSIIMFIAGIQFLTAGMLADLINKKARE